MVPTKATTEPVRARPDHDHHAGAGRLVGGAVRSRTSALANVNAGLLLLMAITSIEVYGIIIAGWASNSKYSFMGAMRASAQMISYEIPMGFVLVVVLMVSGSLNFSDIVAGQNSG